MNSVFPLEVTLTITPTALQEKGSSATVKCTWTAKVDGVAVDPTAISINGVSVLGETSYTTTVTDTTTFKLTVTAEGRTATASKTLTFVYPIYTGFAPDTAFSESLISSLTKMALRTSLGGVSDSKTNTSTSNYYWIVSPYKVTSVTTSGINIIADFVQSTTTYNNVTYYTYRLSKASAVGSFTFVIS
uniref:Uncharacterized protein n=1 Tax=Dulem virus 42 TaxID=3145760 RepID=A0AAU8BAW2_9CAUD